MTATTRTTRRAREWTDELAHEKAHQTARNAELLFASTSGRLVLEGTVQHIVFSRPESGWTVARLDVRGKAAPVTAVGALAGVRVGETVQLHGDWVTDRTYGRQFKVETFQSIYPSTLAGIEKYLGSGLVAGIGPGMAKRLVQHFRQDTLRVLDEEPARLREVAGFGAARSQALQEAWHRQRALQGIMVFLQSHGVSAAHALRIHKEYGAQAVDVVRQDPYRLAREVSGIAFKSADHIARALGVQSDAPQRARAAVLFALANAADDGHCYLPQDKLLERAVRLLELRPEAGAPNSARTALQRVAEEAIGELALQRLVVLESDKPLRVYEPRLQRLEHHVADALRRLLQTPSRHAFEDGDRAVQDLERRWHLDLAPEQRQALLQATQHKVIVLTGGPGTGKTTLVRGWTELCENKRWRVVLCAPTGRAARRLADATRRDASTVHRLLEWKPPGRFERDASNPLDGDVFICDETSMLDLSLVNHLLQAIPPDARLVLVGDADQLPSVGPGALLADLIASKCIPTVRLQHIFRQGPRSLISANAHRIRAGQRPLLPPPGKPADFVWIDRDAPEAVLDTLRQLVSERLPRALGVDPRRDVQVLLPMNRGLLGTANVNAMLREALNPGGTPIGNSSFRIGDKVMQMRNNYGLEVYNGDIGVIDCVDPGNGRVEVCFDDRRVAYEQVELGELTLAYACTVHKAQGSEYPVVVFVVHSQHHIMLQRHLLYTAVTRAQRQVVLIGQSRALDVALDNSRLQTRYTQLAARLRAVGA